jgi:hypothetical protein
MNDEQFHRERGLKVLVWLSKNGLRAGLFELYLCGYFCASQIPLQLGLVDAWDDRVRCEDRSRRRF